MKLVASILCLLLLPALAVACPPVVVQSFAQAQSFAVAAPVQTFAVQTFAVQPQVVVQQVPVQVQSFAVAQPVVQTQAFATAVAQPVAFCPSGHCGGVRVLGAGRVFGRRSVSRSRAVSVQRSF